jgi:hypothetical protein
MESGGILSGLSCLSPTPDAGGTAMGLQRAAHSGNDTSNTGDTTRRAHAPKQSLTDNSNAYNRTHALGATGQQCDGEMSASRDNAGAQTFGCPAE